MRRQSIKTRLKAVVLMALLLLVAMPGHAILKGADMKRTVVMLDSELKQLVADMPQANADFQKRRQEYWGRIRSLMSEERELALVMYSQQEQYLFGTAHAARRVSAMETEFESIAKPMDTWRTEQTSLIHRYQEMLKTLSSIHDYELDARSRSARATAEANARLLISNAKKNVALIDADEKHYQKDYEQIESMDADAQEAFQYIKSLFFVNGGHGFTYYLDHPENFAMVATDVASSLTFSYGGEYAGEWSSRMYLILGAGLLAMLIGCVLTYFGVRMLRSRMKTPQANRLTSTHTGRFVVWLGGVTLLTLTMLFLHVFVLQRNFFVVVTEMMVEYCVLVFVLMVGILYRVHPEHIRQTMRLYAPTLVATGVLMLLRMFLVANVTISITVVVVMAVCTIWQLLLNLRAAKGVHAITSACSWTAFLVFLVGLIASWNGYHYATMFGVMLWSCVLTILVFLFCGYDVVARLDKRYLHDISSVKRAWVKVTLSHIVMPFLGLLFLVGSVYWIAHIFDIEDWVAERFAYDFVAIEGVVRISAIRIASIALLALLTNYLVFMLRSILSEVYGDRSKVGAVALVMNVGTIVLWGCYIFAVLVILNINHMGLLAAISGMTVGIGIALKDTIDCIISGVSLMMGRVHVGDIIECDGIRGKVKDIQYRSTLIEALDGSVIVFLNNQLFSKNFKNLTRNHGYEFMAIMVGVAYGTDVERARQIILEAVSDVKDLDPNHAVGVSVNDFGDNSVDLKVGVWLPVAKKGSVSGLIREKIYNAFNREGIEIPFPQRDLHIINGQ